MKIKKIIGYWVMDLPYFLRLPIEKKKKIAVFWAFFRLTLIHIFYIRLFRQKRTHEHFLGMKAHAFNYEDIFFLFAEIFFRGEYAFTTEAVSPRILDCGANIGFASLFFKWRYPNAMIEAFEPDPATFALLKKNILINNFQNVRLHNFALSPIKGEVTFYIDDRHPGSSMMSSNPERGGLKPITVMATTLKPYLSETAVDFLKMDVEGAEVDIIQNLDVLSLFSGIKEMAIEYHHHIGNASSQLAEFLAIIERNSFEYQINARAIPTCEGEQFQDINIFCYKRKETQRN